MVNKYILTKVLLFSSQLGGGGFYWGYLYVWGTKNDKGGLYYTPFLKSLSPVV